MLRPDSPKRKLQRDSLDVLTHRDAPIYISMTVISGRQQKRTLQKK